MGVCDQKGRCAASLYVGTGIRDEEKGGSPRSVCIPSAEVLVICKFLTMSYELLLDA